MMFLTVAACALVFEAAVGYPARVVRAIGHPVIWIGALITSLDRRLNKESWPNRGRRTAGILVLAVLLAAAAGTAWIVQALLLELPVGFLLLVAAASTLLAQRSLNMHVADVAVALERGDIDAGRYAVSHIVGRDTGSMDEAAMCRATMESLAENFSDAVVAPAFWLALGGLPLCAAYKAINTADSMIGHRTPRYAAFGWAAARLDDLVNLPASRLSALLLVSAATLVPGARAGAAWVAVRRDARFHRSPNAGWPEAAMAGALDLMLAGPRIYAGVRVDDRFMGGGRYDATVMDVRHALRLYRVADALLIALVTLGAGIFLIVRA